MRCENWKRDNAQTSEKRFDTVKLTKVESKKATVEVSLRIIRIKRPGLFLIFKLNHYPVAKPI